jgi:hypothetical protein
MINKNYAQHHIATVLHETLVKKHIFVPDPNLPHQHRGGTGTDLCFPSGGSKHGTSYKWDFDGGTFAPEVPGRAGRRRVSIQTVKDPPDDGDGDGDSAAASSSLASEFRSSAASCSASPPTGHPCPIAKSLPYMDVQAELRRPAAAAAGRAEAARQAVARGRIVIVLRGGAPAAAAQGVPRRAAGVPGPRAEAHRRDAAPAPPPSFRGPAPAPAPAAILQLAVVLVPAGRGGRRHATASCSQSAGRPAGR